MQSFDHRTKPPEQRSAPALIVISRRLVAASELLLLPVICVAWLAGLCWAASAGAGSAGCALDC